MENVKFLMVADHLGAKHSHSSVVLVHQKLKSYQIFADIQLGRVEPISSICSFSR